MFLSSYLSFKVVDIFLLFLKWAIYSDVYEFEDCLLKLDDFDNDLAFYKRKVQRLFYSVKLLRDICCIYIRKLLGLNIYKKLQMLMDEGYIVRVYVDLLLLIQEFY